MRFPRVFVALDRFVAALCLLGATTGIAEPAVVIENADLKTTVAASGTISVLDKGNGRLWTQPAQPTPSPFRHIVAPTPGSAMFDTIFHSDKDLPGHVKLELHGRNLALQVRLDDTNTPITAFDFLAPFQSATNLSLVIPDFCDGHIYPCAISHWPLYNLDSIKALNLTMPWVGVVDLKTGSGYSLIFDTPYDAQLKLSALKGLRAPAAAWNPELGRFGYPRSVTYTFTAHGGYVALAKAYREHARAEGLLVTFAEKARTRPAITNLFGAPVLWDFDDQLSDQTLRALGVTRAIHHVERWDGGFANREKLDLANRLGFVTEEYDYYLAGPMDGRPQQYQDYHISTNECVRDAGGRILAGERNWGMRCTEFYLPAAKRILPARLKAFPQTARYFDQITQNYDGHDVGPRGGGSTEECFDPQHLKTRTAWVKDVDEFYQYAAQTLGLITGAELGKFHQVPFTELFYGMESCYWPWPDVTFPRDRGADTNAWSTYENWAMNPSTRVPLWQLVFRDCAVGTLYPWDGNDVCYQIGTTNQDLKDCLNLLYGTPATFMVAGRGHSEFFHQPQRWLQSYRNNCKILEVLADKEMVAHHFLTADRSVQETDWSDGTHVIVNFGTNDFSLTNGQRLTQFCFATSGPWGEALRAYDAAAGRVITTIRLPGYCFDDKQATAGQPISLALWRKATNKIQVNVDEIRGQTNVSFIIRPTAAQPDWNFKTTHVYLCDATDGHRLREIPWTSTGADEIAVSGLQGWIVLDVVSD